MCGHPICLPQGHARAASVLQGCWLVVKPLRTLKSEPKLTEVMCGRHISEVFLLLEWSENFYFSEILEHLKKFSEVFTRSLQISAKRTSRTPDMFLAGSALHQLFWTWENSLLLVFFSVTKLKVTESKKYIWRREGESLWCCGNVETVK